MMQTVILLIGRLGKAVTKEMLDSLIRFVGEMNIDPDGIEGPGCVYLGLLSDEEKNLIEEKMLAYSDISDVAYIEYYPDKPTSSTTLMLLYKE